MLEENTFFISFSSFCLVIFSFRPCLALWSAPMSMVFQVYPEGNSSARFKNIVQSIPLRDVIIIIRGGLIFVSKFMTKINERSKNTKLKQCPLIPLKLVKGWLSKWSKLVRLLFLKSSVFFFIFYFKLFDINFKLILMSFWRTVLKTSQHCSR